MEHISEVLYRIFEQLSVIQKEVTKKNTPFLSIEEASNYLGLPIGTLYQYTSQRQIPFYKTGRKLFFARKELDEWILDKEKRSATQQEIESEVITQMYIER